MQTNFENKLDSVISRFVDGHTNRNQLKHDLSCEKEKSNRLQSDLTLLVRERNIEVDVLNETIASLQGKISTVEKINDQQN
jgi:bacterioferritin (cytochrome b1)